MYFSRNSGITHYSGHFAAAGRIHYYESRLYLLYLLPMKKMKKIVLAMQNTFPVQKVKEICIANAKNRKNLHC